MNSFGFKWSICMFLMLTTFSKILKPPPLQDWRQHEGAILKASQSWEDGTIFEPSVIYDDNRFKMWYGGGKTECRVGYAESVDGFHWTKHKGAVLGHGAGGWNGMACRNNVIKHQGVYYAYFVDGGGSGYEALYVAKSTDGIYFQTQQEPVFKPEKWAKSIANSSILIDGDTWRLVYEARTNDDSLWKIGTAVGNSPYHFTAQPNYIGTLQQLWGMYGGPNLIYRNNEYELYYTASEDGFLPTDIYYAHSSDFIQWQSHPTPVISRTQAWQGDQTADPAYVEALRQKWIFFAGCDNAVMDAVICAIGVATRFDITD